MHPAELHRSVERAFNAGDVDALVALYEPEARLALDDGTEATGVDQIRATWAGFIALGGTLAMTTRHAIEADGLALLSNEWTFELDGAVAAASITAEVARRQPDGSWRYVIDHPYAQPPARPVEAQPEGPGRSSPHRQRRTRRLRRPPGA